MTLSKARKVLGKLSKPLSDDQIQKEIDIAASIAEIVLTKYKENQKNKELEYN